MKMLKLFFLTVLTASLQLDCTQLIMLQNNLTGGTVRLGSEKAIGPFVPRWLAQLPQNIYVDFGKNQYTIELSEIPGAGCRGKRVIAKVTTPGYADSSKEVCVPSTVTRMFERNPYEFQNVYFAIKNNATASENELPFKFGISAWTSNTAPWNQKTIIHPADDKNITFTNSPDNIALRILQGYAVWPGDGITPIPGYGCIKDIYNNTQYTLLFTRFTPNDPDLQAENIEQLVPPYSAVPFANVAIPVANDDEIDEDNKKIYTFNLRAMRPPVTKRIKIERITFPIPAGAKAAEILKIGDAAQKMLSLLCPCPDQCPTAAKDATCPVAEKPIVAQTTVATTTPAGETSAEAPATPQPQPPTQSSDIKLAAGEKPWNELNLEGKQKRINDLAEKIRNKYGVDIKVTPSTDEFARGGKMSAPVEVKPGEAYPDIDMAKNIPWDTAAQAFNITTVGNLSASVAYTSAGFEIYMLLSSRNTSVALTAGFTEMTKGGTSELTASGRDVETIAQDMEASVPDFISEITGQPDLSELLVDNRYYITNNLFRIFTTQSGKPVIIRCDMSKKPAPECYPYWKNPTGIKATKDGHNPNFFKLIISEDPTLGIKLEMSPTVYLEP